MRSAEWGEKRQQKRKNGETMDNTFSIAIPDKMNEELNNVKDLLYPQLDTNQMITNLIEIGLQAYESNKEQENTDCIKGNNQDLETNVIELESNLGKLKLLNDNLKEHFFSFDVVKKPNSVLYGYDNATIQCDIIQDYIVKLQEISSNIQNLIYS